MPQQNRLGSAPPAAQFEISREFDASRELVWKAFTESERLAQWWGPKGFQIRVKQLDFRPGGIFHYYMIGAGGQITWGRFIYGAITAPIELEFINSFSDEHGNVVRAPFSATWPLEVLNTLTFSERDGKTTLTLRGAPVNATGAELETFKAGFDSMRLGFGGTWDQLAAYLRGLIASTNSMAENGMAQTSSQHATFVIERRFNASPVQVYHAFSDPVAKAQWFAGGADWTQQTREMDFRVGGHERLQGAWSGGIVSSFDAHYQDIVPGRRIVYTYVMHLDDRRISVSLATIELTSDGDATHMRYTEQAVFLDGYDDAGSRERGTLGLFDRLDAQLQRSIATA